MKSFFLSLFALLLLHCGSSQPPLKVVHNDPSPKCKQLGTVTKRFSGSIDTAKADLGNEAKSRYPEANYLQQESLVPADGGSQGTIVATAFACPPEEKPAQREVVFLPMPSAPVTTAPPPAPSPPREAAPAPEKKPPKPPTNQLESEYRDD